MVLLGGRHLRELVGTCSCCNKEVYCLDGFLNGVLSDEKYIYCMECYENLFKEKENPQS